MKIKYPFILNLAINKLVNIYKEKELFMIDYNPNWKNKVNMGKKNNRNFYQISYKKFLDKLIILNKKLLLVRII